MRTINHIIVHCSATRPDWMAGQSLAAQVNEIRRWHVHERGWRDIGYHWIVGRDGMLMPGRPEAEMGAHVRGANADSIGICLIGGHGSAQSDHFSEHFTQAQDDQLRELISTLLAKHERETPIRVSGHNEWAAKACPGFDVPTWLEDWAPRLDDRVTSLEERVAALEALHD